MLDPTANRPGQPAVPSIMIKFPALEKQAASQNWYFRAKSPDGKRKMVATGTPDRAEALRRQARWYVDRDRAERDAERPAKPAPPVKAAPTVPTTPMLCERYAQKVVKEVRDQRIADTAEPEAYVTGDTGKLEYDDDGEPTNIAYRDALYYREKHVAELRDDIAARLLRATQPIPDLLAEFAFAFTEGLGTTTEPDVRTIAVAGITALQKLQREDERAKTNATPSKPAVTVRDVLTHYHAQRPGLNAHTIEGQRAMVEALVAVAGEKAITDYTLEDASAWSKLMLSLPPNWTKHKALRDLNIIDAAAKARKLGLAPQKPKTLKIKKSFLAGLFKFARGNYSGVNNPFADLVWHLKEDAATDQRDAYTLDELRQFLSEATLRELDPSTRWVVVLGL